MSLCILYMPSLFRSADGGYKCTIRHCRFAVSCFGRKRKHRAYETETANAAGIEMREIRRGQ